MNLNFTAGHDAMAAAVERCGITTILTARAFVAKAGIETMDGMVFVEDFLKAIPLLTKLRTALAVKAMPARWLARRYAHETAPDEVATIIFSSGSTGVPKGVMLTHRNILSNIDASMQVFKLTEADVMIGVLPFFHAFGFTATLWLPLINGFGVVYHPNPMDAKTIGEIAAKYRGTIIISTPTFYSTYIRKVQPEQFANLRYGVVGAEKLRAPIAAAFRERFGIDLIEGYGCTEMSPVVAVNMPESRPGSVGRPIPGVRAQIVDPVTGEGPLVGEEGMLLVSGPSRMLGYLDDPAPDRGGLSRRVVHHRRHRDDRRRWLHPHHRPPVAVQQDRGRDGAAHESRGGNPGAPRRKARGNGDIRGGRDQRRAIDCVLFGPGHQPCGTLGEADSHLAAPPVDPEARGSPADGVHPDSRQRQGRHPESEANRVAGITPT